MIKFKVKSNFNLKKDWVLPSPFLLSAYKKFGTFLERITPTDRGDLWFAKKLRSHLSRQNRYGQFQLIHALSNAQFSVVLLFTDEFMI